MPTQKPNNGVRITNREMYDKLEVIEDLVRDGLARRPTWAALGKLAGLLIAAGGLFFAVWS